jgi:hypothetical protein
MKNKADRQPDLPAKPVFFEYLNKALSLMRQGFIIS